MSEKIEVPASTRLKMKAEFIHAVARYLSFNQAGKSIALEVEQKAPRPVEWAREWAEVRAAAPRGGYMSVEETEALLWDLLG